MTRNTILTCVSLPVAVVLGIMVLGFVATQTLPPVPALEELETFNWVHSQ